ncbi:hypothetical protein E2C06_08015 [Dankookia rubra]|uniref:Inovirus Gp2 family protein n=1 Tax=Dankookia rubra TaxID=1442381 RepID=A0A4V3AAH6_9PROT|nr:hypothetical protein [Dankookia rubra]TDH63305.1 hypothetical protein E2C06_08015 [Dankookia rubra]
MANIPIYTKPVVNRADYLEALRRELEELAPALFVTLVFNRSTTLESAIKALDHFHACVDNALLGSKWAKPNRRSRRTRFLAIAENVGSNLHLHLGVVPADRKNLQFWQVSRRIWKNAATSGNIDMDQWRYGPGAIDYMLKQVRPELSENIHYSRHYEAGRSAGC